MRPKLPQKSKELESSQRTNSQPGQSPEGPSNNPGNKIPAPEPTGALERRTSKTSLEDPARRGVIKFDRERAALVLNKIDQLVAALEQSESERDARFAELGQYLCEVRDGQYYKLDNLQSFEDFLQKKFPESRRKAYYLMAIQDQLPREARLELKQIGWTKARELARIARVEGPKFDSAPWVHKAKTTPREAFRREVKRHLTGKDPEPCATLCFLVQKGQLAVIEQALTAAFAVLRGRQSRGSCLEFICANFVADVRRDTLNADTLSNVIGRFFGILPIAEKRSLLEALGKRV